MRRAICVFILSAILLPAAAHAQPPGPGLTVSPALVSDFVFRGVTQTADDPAAQLGIDFTGQALHLGVWTSNVRFDQPTGFYGDRHTEVRLRGDLFGGSDQVFRWDGGITGYIYPGWSSFPELFAEVSRDWLSAALHYSWSFGQLAPHASAWYLQLDARWPVPQSAFALLAHAGYSWGPYWDRFSTNGGGYSDFAAGVGARIANFDVALEGTFTASYVSIPRDHPFAGGSKLLLTVSTRLPWP